MGTISRCDSRTDFQLGFNHQEKTDHRSEISNDGGGAPVPCDYFGGVYEYIKQMLMEEDDLDHRPCMFQDCSALQAAEKYFFDALSGAAAQTPSAAPFTNSDAQFVSSPSVISCNLDWFGSEQENSRNFRVASDDQNTPTEKTRGRDECTDGRSSKKTAPHTEESFEIEKYDKSLLCQKMNPGFYDGASPSDDEEPEETKKEYRKTKEVKRGRPKGSKKNRKVNQVVDIGSLLTRCAEAVAAFNLAAGANLLKQIREHSSPNGDANDRLAHYFANALEARMAGTGAALYTATTTRRVPAAELLKSYQAYVTACPFKRMSNIIANKSIGRFSKEANRVHIIDFGILYGFQWPCIIQGLSLKPGGPPVLKITGIDYPQPGFKPAERVEQTGKRLAEYCKRFNVPFEYKAIAKRWEEIELQDLDLDREEMVVVNCLYRLRHVADESSSSSSSTSGSPRDAVINLIKQIKPDLFVHGVVNGSYNASFFTTRFKEAVFHYSSLFDMMEATLPREDGDRAMYEREVLGRDVMNVIACEGGERVERPETYKQWNVRNQRAGFVQLPMCREIVDEVKAKLRSDYHNDFLLEEDGGWLLQGWKGRVIYALSCWRPSSR